MGPWAYVQHLISTPRLPFTAAYFGSIALTLYFSLGASIFLFPVCHPTRLIELLVASDNLLDHYVMFDTTSLSNLVFGELFSHGLEWPANCYDLWSSAGSSMDDRMSEHGSKEILVASNTAHVLYLS